MAFEARILADSIAPNGKRLITQLWKYPRPIHAEIMTHRMWSKNSASSRAIPTAQLIRMVNDDPWIPDYIGKNQKGMAPGEELSDSERNEAVKTWLDAKENAVRTAEHLLSLGVHKGVVNRVLEPWMWITIVISATELPNLYALRLDKMAEPHFQHITRMSKVAIDQSVPCKLGVGEWHLPFIYGEDRRLAFTAVTGREFSEGLDVLPHDHPTLIAMWEGLNPAWVHANVDEMLKKVAVGRCARVSYLTHDGRRDLKEDVALHDRLVVQRPLHASPAEHVAQALDTLEWSGNFCGFRQYRKLLPHENITSWDDVPRIT